MSRKQHQLGPQLQVIVLGGRTQELLMTGGCFGHCELKSTIFRGRSNLFCVFCLCTNACFTILFLYIHVCRLWPNEYWWKITPISDSSDAKGVVVFLVCRSVTDTRMAAKWRHKWMAQFLGNITRILTCADRPSCDVYQVCVNLVPHCHPPTH